MNRYIDADAALKQFEEMHGNESELLNCYNADWIVSFIEAQPTADVQEVKHAKDLQSERAFSSWTFECSRCHFFDDDTYCIVSQIDSIKYCPNCGAKIDLEDDE